MVALTHKQAKLVGRIRDAFTGLGLLPASVPHGTLGTAMDLAAMAPIISKFARKQGAAFAAKIRSTQDLDARAALIAAAAEATVRKLPVQKLATAATIIGEGFVAYRRAKKEADKLSTLVGVVENVTAALGR